MSYPVIHKLEELKRLLQQLAEVEVPNEKLGAGFFRKLDYSVSSGKALLAVLKGLGFVNDEDQPTPLWREYSRAKEGRGAVLAGAIKNAYPDLFRLSSCPYLEADEEILSILKRGPKTSPKDAEAMLDTFRALSDLADFQELLACDSSGAESEKPADGKPGIKVNPNLQLNIQVHIDPATPEDKIEAIFRNMRKYLLGKSD